MKLYVSFGYKYNLRNSLMEFQDKTEYEVREYMIKEYNNRYAFIYDEDSAKEQIMKFNLTIVSPGTKLVEY